MTILSQTAASRASPGTSNVPSPHTLQLIGSIDQGTQTTKFTLYDMQLRPVATSCFSHQQFYPQPGWCEHDAMEILANTYKAIYCAIRAAEEKLLHVDTVSSGSPSPGGGALSVRCIGIANQRETFVVWRKSTGIPYHRAIVWLDTRGKAISDQLSSNPETAAEVHRLTGLPLNSYFSASKIQWLLDNRPDIRTAILDGSAILGTIDTWLIWNLTGGAEGSGAFVTDITNASRTSFMSLDTCQWDHRLLRLFHYPFGHAGTATGLPTIRSCCEVYGHVSAILPKSCEALLRYASVKEGQIEVCSFDPATHTLRLCPVIAGAAISGCIGDQQAACIGQKLFSVSGVKCTYGTGAFILMNTGETKIFSKCGLLTTPCYKLGPKAPVSWAMEGCIAIAGAGVSWLCDNMGLIESPEDTEGIIQNVPDTGGVVFVPAFSGLLAPQWREDARGCIVGLTQHTRRAHVVKALMEGVAYQIYEVLKAFGKEFRQSVEAHGRASLREKNTAAAVGSSGIEKLDLRDEDAEGAGSVGTSSEQRKDPSLRCEGIQTMRVDGGMSKNGAFMQLTADILGISIERPHDVEVTSLGAAMASGIGANIFTSETVVSGNVWPESSGVDKWEPTLSEEQRHRKLQLWTAGVERSLGWPAAMP